MTCGNGHLYRCSTVNRMKYISSLGKYAAIVLRMWNCSFHSGLRYLALSEFSITLQIPAAQQLWQIQTQQGQSVCDRAFLYGTYNSYHSCVTIAGDPSQHCMIPFIHEFTCVFEDKSQISVKKIPV